MGPLVLTNAALKTLVTNAVQASAGAVKGALNGAFVGIFTSVIIPRTTVVIGDLTEPTYTGYARVAVVWGSPEKFTGGNWGAVGTQVLDFQMAPGDAAVQVTGYFLASAITAGELLGLAVFDTPVNLLDSDQILSLVPEFSLPASTDWGEASLLGP